jgi:hypothetical protein
MIYGKAFYRGGSTAQIYRQGAAANVADFHNRITKGKVDNPTVAPSVRSTLVTILGRTATHERRTVTWQETVASQKKTDLKLEGLKA